MKTLLLLLIAFTEIQLAFKVIGQYTKDGSLPDFIARAPLEKFLYVKHHLTLGWITLQLATITSLLK